MTDDMQPFADEQPIETETVWETPVEPEQPAAMLVELTDESEPVTFTADENEAVSGAEIPPRPTFFEWIGNLFSGSSSGQTQVRLDELTRMIELEPEAPANYVFRGELYCRIGQYEQAAADFQFALAAANAELDGADWGFMAQTLRDRAVAGLNRLERRLVFKGKTDDSGW